MAGNTIGSVFRLTTFGESHGPAIGGVVDGCPAGLGIEIGFIQQELIRRRPGLAPGASPRNEEDTIEIISGIHHGKTLGTPIAFLMYTQDQKPADYEHLKNVFRPGHADFAYHQKYGIRDVRGGGRSSARETSARVAAGAIAKQLLGSFGVSIQAYVSSIGPIALETDPQQLDLTNTEKSSVRCPDDLVSAKMLEYLETVRMQGDTIGGVVTCIAKGVPPGWGEPVFDKLQADLAKAMLSINAAKGFEYGSGFRGTTMLGSEHNDIFETRTTINPSQKQIRTRTNFSGGIQGGISNGEDIYFRVAFKAVSSIMKDQPSVDLQGQATIIHPRGRHDVCVVPRAVPIVEAMAAIILADHCLRGLISKL